MARAGGEQVTGSQVGSRVLAWQPAIPGVREVLHARFTEHAYPMHTHDVWTLLIVDAGMVRYDLDHHQHGAMTSLVTLLPPDVPHDGRPAGPEGFRKRVIYLDRGVLDDDLIGAAVDRPGLLDPVLRRRLHQLHDVLALRTEDLEAQTRLALISERLQHHLQPAARTTATIGTTETPRAARLLRDLLDARIPQGLALDQAARQLHNHPTHLVRAFSKEYGLPPHLYLTGRRVDLARRYLLDGTPPAEAAVLAGFYDQAHLTRHFTRILGVSPARFARNRPPDASSSLSY
jgi:AraC-like DNA-binding protein